MTYKRLDTIAVKVGNLIIGNHNSIRTQTMTTTDTMDTQATVAQAIRCIQAGAELIRITAPSKKEAENLYNIKKAIRAAGYDTPLIADIHYTPNAAEIAAHIIEKVRINPGNYIDKKNFNTIEYTNLEYEQEIEKVRNRFLPLVKICKTNGTAMRIGTNHGSLSDRILSRYGDTPLGMVESAMEFLRIAIAENYNQIILSMKASNPLIMVQAYRTLVQQMQAEFGFCFPLHLGVTEAGDGEDGRIKSAIGIGTLLEEGIGDTIRVSLTEDPEFEIPVCQDIIARYANKQQNKQLQHTTTTTNTTLNQQQYTRNKTHAIQNIGNGQVPIVIANLQHTDQINETNLKDIGYEYNAQDDKWNIKDNAADYILLQQHNNYDLPKSLKCIIPIQNWQQNADNQFPTYTLAEWQKKSTQSPTLNFIYWNIEQHNNWDNIFTTFNTTNNAVFIIQATTQSPYLLFKKWAIHKTQTQNKTPYIWHLQSLTSPEASIDTQLIHFATETGALFLDGYGDGIHLQSNKAFNNTQAKGRTYINIKNTQQFLNQTAFSILQATRLRISKTEYISCPSCGRTLFDLQSTTTQIRNATQHLKGVKIAVMGCIVNGPGEMADADFGYVGSGINKIHLYKSKEIIKKNINSNVAVAELIQLIKDSGRWNEPV